MSTESDRDKMDAEARRGGPSVPTIVYIALAIVVLIPVGWLLYRAGGRSSAPSSAAVQESAPPTKADTAQFNKYTADGLGYYQKHDWTNAESSFREALKYEPKSALGLSNMGSVHNERGEYDAAIPLFQEAVSVDPTLQIARNNLAWAIAQKAKQGK